MSAETRDELRSAITIEIADADDIAGKESPRQSSKDADVLDGGCVAHVNEGGQVRPAADQIPVRLRYVGLRLGHDDVRASIAIDVSGREDFPPEVSGGFVAHEHGNVGRQDLGIAMNAYARDRIPHGCEIDFPGKVLDVGEDEDYSRVHFPVEVRRAGRRDDQVLVSVAVEVPDIRHGA